MLFCIGRHARRHNLGPASWWHHSRPCCCRTMLELSDATEVQRAKSARGSAGAIPPHVPVSRQQGRDVRLMARALPHLRSQVWMLNESRPHCVPGGVSLAVRTGPETGPGPLTDPIPTPTPELSLYCACSLCIYFLFGFIL